MNIITTEKRPSDWIAFAFGDRRIREAGRTEFEAAGKLILRLSNEHVPTCYDCKNYEDGECTPFGPLCQAWENAHA